MTNQASRGNRKNVHRICRVGGRELIEEDWEQTVFFRTVVFIGIPEMRFKANEELKTLILIPYRDDQNVLKIKRRFPYKHRNSPIIALLRLYYDKCYRSIGNIFGTFDWFGRRLAARWNIIDIRHTHDRTICGQ